MRDYTGLRSGRLVMLERAYPGKHGYYWKCQCDCGNIVYAIGTRVMQGHVRSCGCLYRDTKPTLRHGEARNRLYNLWSSMKARCNNPSNTRYAQYGGRGIRVCDEWQRFDAFRDWAYANGYEINAEYGKTTIDRIDPNGDYEPSNCRFADMKTQANNKLTNVRIEYNGETRTLAEWSEHFGINDGTLRDRYKRGLRGDRLFAQKDLRFK